MRPPCRLPSPRATWAGSARVPSISAFLDSLFNSSPNCGEVSPPIDVRGPQAGPRRDVPPSPQRGAIRRAACDSVDSWGRRGPDEGSFVRLFAGPSVVNPPEFQEGATVPQARAVGNAFTAF